MWCVLFDGRGAFDGSGFELQVVGQTVLLPKLHHSLAPVFNTQHYCLYISEMRKYMAVAATLDLFCTGCSGRWKSKAQDEAGSITL